MRLEPWPRGYVKYRGTFGLRMMNTMTDRYHALTVVLESDTRSDDAEAIISAIQQVRGVLSVEPHAVNLGDPQ